MIELTKIQIDEIFNNELNQDKPNQLNILINLYKIAFPCYDNIKKLHNWPTVGKQTSNYLFEKFIQFDKKIHPEIFAGGLWLNNGFSSDNDIPDWLIDNSKCEIIYKKAD